MDIGRAFTFVTEDDEWLSKLGIAALISLLSFLILPAFLLLGYTIQVTRNVKDNVALPLPRWDDWGKLFMDGIYVALAQLIYTIPFWLLACVGTILSVGFGQTTEDIAAAGLTVTWVILGCLAILFAIALFFISPAIIIQYVRTDDFGATLRVGEVFAIARENIGQILIVALVTLVVSFTLSAVLGVLNLIPCLGQIASVIIGILAGPWIAVATGHLYGQIARQIAGKVPPKPAY